MTDTAIDIAPELLTTAQAAALLGLAPRTFQQQAASGRIGPMPVRLGRAVRWPRRELCDWIDAGCPPRERWVQQRERVMK